MLSILRNVKRSVLLELEKHQNKGIYTDVHENFDIETHLRKATDWLCRAQDHGDDNGFSYGAHFRGNFLTSYPETTGYIIPTLLKLADYWNDPDLEKRAVKAGEWEIDIQLDCGAVMGGRVDATPQTTAIFNTGTVLQGWAALLDRTGNDIFNKAGCRAADWLLSMQEPDGAWRKGNSQFATGKDRVYNVFSAWGLCTFGKASGDDRYIKAAVKNAEFAILRQSENGWFPDCCLNAPTSPLLHTLAYTMQGLLEIGLILEQSEFIKGSQLIANTLIKSMKSDGFLSGRFFSDFSDAAEWCCLTGSAQTSIVWSKLYSSTGNQEYKKSAELINRYLMSRHDLTSQNDAINGALAGSWPVWGEYGRFQVFNWATKFLTDALLLEEEKL